MDEQTKKTALRMFTYGMYAVTAKHAGEVAAMTANFLTQSSFTPPMVAVAVEVDSKTHRVIEASGAFAVNVFESGQRELAGQLGRKSRKSPDKFDGVAWTPGPATGAPILEAALGWVECRVTGKVESGDHTIYVAEVVEAGVHREGAPLSMAEAGFRHSG
ncbi:MAG: flavin reductase family protein [Chloroflexi bacterium]|nr:flavin reductase family protein [Chloroflexota bacterium]